MVHFALALTLLLMSVVVHEAGHWMVLRRFRVPVESFGIGLGPDLLRWRRFHVGMLPIGASLTPCPATFRALAPLQRLCVALAGPWLSALYATLLLLGARALPSGSVEANALLLLSHLNWLLAGLNLLPAPPLDGFRALEAWLEHRGCLFSPRAREVLYRAGNGLVYGFGFAAIGVVLGQGWR